MDNRHTKLNRQYRLLIQQQDKQGNPLETLLHISNRDYAGMPASPLTIKFNVDRTIYSGVANMTIDIYNLSPNNRNLLFRDWFYIVNQNKTLYISLEAGYEGGDMGVIFLGDIWNAYNLRQGSDIITRIQAKTGLRNMANLVNITIKQNEKLSSVIDACMDKLPNLKKGAISIADYTITEPIALMGKPLAILKQYNPDKYVYVDLDTVNILAENEYDKKYQVKLFTDENGLLNAPERRAATLSFNVIFDPTLVVGELIELKSNIAPQFNGQYKIFGLKHNGTISDSIAGTATTTVEVNVGSQIFGEFLPV